MTQRDWGTLSMTYTPEREYRSPLSQQFAEQFLAGQLVLDLPRITLRRRVETATTINGRGFISLEAADDYKLRVYADDNEVDPFLQMRTMGTWVSGQEVPDSDYFDLTAEDLNGYQWKSELLLLQVHGMGPRCVVTANVFRLTCRIEGLQKVDNATLSVWFPEDLSLFKQPSDNCASRAQPCAAINLIDAAPLQKPLTGVRVRMVSCTSEIPDRFEWRVQDALRYVTMQPVAWCVLDKRELEHREVVIARRVRSHRGLFCAPVDYESHPAIDAWNLFFSYLEYTLSRKDTSTVDPISAHLHLVVAAESNQVDLIALLVCIAVEGLLKDCFEEAGRPTAEVADFASRLAARVRAWKCNEASLPQRIAGSIEQIKNSRPRDKLISLAKRGIVSTAMVNDWTKLRNKHAHASGPSDPSSAHTTFLNANSVYAMLNQLIFETIAYQGVFQDFGASGWPVRRFVPNVGPTPIAK